MIKTVVVTPIVTVLAGFRSTNRRKENIKKLYKFVNESKDRPTTK
jgi:hypothetical protein